MTEGTGGAKRSQLTAQIDDELEKDVAVAIAALKKERDLVGRGLSVVLRRAVRTYVRSNLQEYRDQLDTKLQDRLRAAGR